MKPKNDAARKAWLVGLKDGDEAIHAEPNGNLHLGRVRRSDRDIRLDMESRSGARRRSYFTLITGKGMLDNGTSGWLIPASEPVKVALAQKEKLLLLRHKLSGRYFFREFTDEQIVAVAAILWPEATP